MSQGKTPSKPFVTAAAPQKLELTAYQGGQAVVREERVVTLPEGTSNLAFDGLPQQFVQGSLTIVSVEGKGKFKLGPISYRPASLSPQAILSKSLGRHVTLFNVTAQGAEMTEGKLLHLLGNQAVLERHGAIFVAPITAKFHVAGGLPAGLTSKASLNMEPTVEQGGEFAIKVLYETNGIGWESRYEAFYDAKNEKLNRVMCWVDLTNNSGADLNDATFKLIAQTNFGARSKGGNRGMAMAAAAPQMAGGGLESMSFSADAAASESVGEAKL